MTYQKLTYSGTECNNYVHFSFEAEYFDTDIITKGLMIEPTSVKIKKEPVPKFTSWDFRVDAGNEVDLETYLATLLDVFEPKIEDIVRLKHQYKLTTYLQFVIDVDINPNASTPCFGLNKRAIYFLSKTETEVNFDLYKADTIGLLTNLNKDGD